MSLTAQETLTLSDIVVQEISRSEAPPHVRTKQLCERIAFQLTQLIHKYRDEVLATMRVEQQKFVEECKNGTRPRYSFLPTVQETFAKRLWDILPEETKKLPADCGVTVEVHEGYCFLARSQWFVVTAEPERVLEPMWSYIVDPLPFGVVVFDATGTAQPGRMLITAPNSSWTKNYAGVPEEVAREQERIDDAAQKA
jgi:hypothetical protein